MPLRSGAAMSRRETEVGFAADSLLEREGFDPSVPREEEPARRDGFFVRPFRHFPFERDRGGVGLRFTESQPRKNKHPAPWQLAGCEARRIWVFTVWIRSTRMIPRGAGHRKRAPCGYVL